MESINKGEVGGGEKILQLIGESWTEVGDVLILVAQRVPASVQGAKAGIWRGLLGGGNIPAASPSTVPAGWAPPATF